MNFHKINKLLIASNLTKEDRDSLLILFSRTMDKELEPVVELFTNKPEWIERVNENYKAKQGVLSGGLQNWADILKEEDKNLTKFLS